jgi:hypothetical protein
MNHTRDFSIFIGCSLSLRVSLIFLTNISLMLPRGRTISPGFDDEVFIGSIAEMLSSEFAPA